MSPSPPIFVVVLSIFSENLKIPCDTLDLRATAVLSACNTTVITAPDRVSFRIHRRYVYIVVVRSNIVPRQLRFGIRFIGVTSAVRFFLHP